MEHPRPEQVEIRPPVHLAFDQFEPIDLSFELTITPSVKECVLYPLVVFADPSCETDKLFQLTALSEGQTQ
jgi:hypothetical protein